MRRAYAGAILVPRSEVHAQQHARFNHLSSTRSPARLKYRSSPVPMCRAGMATPRWKKSSMV
jgi:hypothetical protein